MLDVNFDRYLHSVLIAGERTIASISDDLIDNWERQRFVHRLQNDYFRDKRRKLLIGEAGSGKSLILVQLLLDAAKNARTLVQREQDFMTQTWTKDRIIIPILIQLRDYENFIVTLIQKSIQNHDVNLHLETATLDCLLRHGNFLLLLDGIDELPSLAARQNLIAFCSQYSATRIIATTGDNLLGGDLGIAEVVRMPPLERSQMRKLVKSYLPEFSGELIEQIDTCWQIAPTPLLLQILCRIPTTLQVPANSSLLLRQFSQQLQHTSELTLLHSLAFAMIEGTSPQHSRFSIYRQEAELILIEELPDRDAVVKTTIDSYLSSGLLKLTDDENLTFTHSLLQQYYAAEFLLTRLPSLSDRQLQCEYLNLVKWTASILLMMPLIEDELQALRIVQLARETDWQLAAKLAGAVKPEWRSQTVAAIASISAPVQFKIFLLDLTRSPEAISELLHLKTQAKPDSWNSVRVIEALGKIGTSEAIVFLCQELQNLRRYSEPIEAAEILARIGTSAEVVALARGLHNTHEDVRIAVVRALGEINSKDAIPVLKTALKDSDSSVRIEAVNALATLGSAVVVAELCQAMFDDSNEYIRRKIAECLGTLKSPDAVPGLIQVAKADKEFGVRLAAVKALGEIGTETAIFNLCELLPLERHLSVKETIATFLANCGSQIAIATMQQALHSSDLAARSCIVTALGKANHPAAIALLCEALHNEDQFVHRGALAALATSDAGVSALLKTLSDDSVPCEYSTIEMLEKIATDAVIPALRVALTAPKNKAGFSDGWRAARALRSIATPLAIATLQEALFDENRPARWNAALALADCQSQERQQVSDLENRDLIVSILCEVLEEGDNYDRYAAACALARTCNETAIPALQTGLTSNYAPVVDWCAIALRHLGTEAAIVALKAAMSDSERGRTISREFWQTGTAEAIASACLALQSPDFDSRVIAARVLGEVGNANVVPVLCQAVNDADEKVCHSAIVALGKIGDVTAIPTLERALAATNNTTRFLAVEALENIGTEAVIPILCQGAIDPNINASDENPNEMAWDRALHDIRDRIVKALCHLNSPAAIPLLLPGLENDNPKIKLSAARVLPKMGDEELLEVWRPLLLESDIQLCLLAIEALEKIATVAAVEALSIAFGHENSQLSYRTIQILENIGSPAAVLALCDMINQQHPSRLTAIEALGYLGNPAATPTLLTALRSQHFEERYRAAVALGKIGATEALPTLLQILEENISSSCYEVANAVGKIGSLELVPQLYDLLFQKDNFCFIDLPSAISLIQGRYGFYQN